MYKRKIELTFGADIEFAVMKVDNPKINYATGYFGGTKEHPIQFPNQPQGYMYQEDGVMLELNIPICHSVEEFRESITHMKGLAEQLAKDRGFVLTKQQTVNLGHLDPMEVPRAFLVGCSPDWDAYGPFERPPFQAQDMGIFRHAGGHIHVGYDVSECPQHLFIRAMDWYLRAAVGQSQKVSSQRVPFYGYEGLYRPKDYGVEYRTLCSWPGYFEALVYDGLRDLANDWNKHREAFFEHAVTMKRSQGYREFHLNGGMQVVA